MACTCNGTCTDHPARPYTYNRALDLLHAIRSDLEILAGNDVGPSGASWQDVAGTCAVNLRALARALDQARTGNAAGPVVFPSLDDAEGV